MAAKIFDKVLCFMGFEEEGNEDEKMMHEDAQEDKLWQKKKDKEKGAVISMHSQRQVRVVVVEPRSFDEAKSITDNLKNRRPVIVNLEQAEPELAKRVVDFVSGAAYALNGSMQKVGSGIFLFVPNNMDISSEIKDQNREKGMFFKIR